MGGRVIVVIDEVRHDLIPVLAALGSLGGRRRGRNGTGRRCHRGCRIRSLRCHGYGRLPCRGLQRIVGCSWEEIVVGERGRRECGRRTCQKWFELFHPATKLQLTIRNAVGVPVAHGPNARPINLQGRTVALGGRQIVDYSELLAQKKRRRRYALYLAGRTEVYYNLA